MKVSLWLVPAIVIGTVLRLLSPTRLALWRDEAQYVAIAEFAEPTAILEFLYRHESHPPLFYLLGHYLGAVGGGVERAIGALSLGASVLAIVAAYWLAASAFSRLAGIIAAMGTAMSVPLVMHSVQLRPYALLALLFVASTAGLWRFLSTGSRASLAVWLIASLLGLYTHYATLLLLAAQGAFVAWSMIRSSGESFWRWRDLIGATGALALLWSPGALWLSHQSRVAGYPARHPIEWDGPPRVLLSMMLDYPLELLLPMVLVLSFAARQVSAYVSRGRQPIRPAVPARGLLFAVVPGFMVIAMLGNYRSALLTPHVLLVVVPLAMVMIGGRFAGLIEGSRRWRAAVLLEGVLVCAVMSALLHVGFAETMAPEVAAIINAEGDASDLVVLSPGVMGASFNLLYAGSQSQIDFPFEGRVDVYPFDNDFEKLADPGRWERALDSIYAAYSGGRRVWFVSDSRWINSYVGAPRVLSPDSLRGIGQADRARANGFYRYLRWLYGPPVAEYGTSASGSGPESMAAWLFAPEERGSGAAP